ncbi:MAG: MFS transporter [Bacteroidetes bacterium]|nr:MFS transporter [Bacteroidota bacterium]
MKQPKVLTRTILLVSFVSLFTDVASEMLYPVMPIYLKSIGFSILLIGILEGVAEAVAGLSKGFFGNLSDQRQKRAPFVRYGYALSAISKPMLALFIYPLWIFFARTLDRIGKGIRTGARDAILSDETTPENKGRVFGFHRSMDTIGAAIGPFLALIYLWLFPGQYRSLFIIAFFPGLIAILLSSLLKDKKHPLTHQFTSSPVHKLSTRISFLSYLSYWKRSTPVFRKLVAGLLVFTLLNSSDVFLLLIVRTRLMNFFTNDPHVADLWMIGIYIFYNLIYAASSYPVGIMADRIGLKIMLIIGLFLFSVVYSGMGFASSIVTFALLFFLYGIYAAATEGISKAWITNIADKSETATAIGFYTSFASIFSLLASSIAGLLWFAFGAEVLFLTSGIGVFCVIIYLYLAVPYHPGNQKK